MDLRHLSRHEQSRHPPCIGKQVWHKNTLFFIFRPCFPSPMVHYPFTNLLYTQEDALPFLLSLVYDFCLPLVARLWLHWRRALFLDLGRIFWLYQGRISRKGAAVDEELCEGTHSAVLSLFRLWLLGGWLLRVCLALQGHQWCRANRGSGLLLTVLLLPDLLMPLRQVWLDLLMSLWRLWLDHRLGSQAGETLAWLRLGLNRATSWLGLSHRTSRLWVIRHQPLVLWFSLDLSQDWRAELERTDMVHLPASLLL